jgi:hypothetical protein
MAQEVFMDIPQVEKMSKSFATFGDTLDVVAKTLEAVSMLLKATAWLSLGSTAAVAAYIDNILPNIRRAAEKLKEISGDIMSAIKAFRDGDMTGSRRFV